MSDLNPWYVTGFCEGEASFTYSRTSKGLNLYFAVKLTAKEQPLIEKLLDFFAVGKIYKVKPIPPKQYSGYTKAALYYRVSRIEELQTIVDHFDKHPLLGEKAKSYQIWREIFELKKQFRHPDFGALEELAKNLSRLASRNQPWQDSSPER